MCGGHRQGAQSEPGVYGGWVGSEGGVEGVEKSMRRKKPFLQN